MIKDTILGLVVGDALGVPVEFESRAMLVDNPVKTMRAYGTYHQPKGTWSDDSSLTLCLMEALTKGYDLVGIAKEFIAWETQAKWTPHGSVFDIGNTTSRAIFLLSEIVEHNDYEALNYLHLEADEYSNGNGSLMRILPLYFYLKNQGLEASFDKIWAVSALTHGHIRAALCCLYYLILLDELIAQKDKKKAYLNTQKRFNNFSQERQINPKEQQLLKRLCHGNIAKLEETAIKSDGYVLHSLEAVVWCLMRCNSYSETVLMAVNLGGDTDTTAAIVGGLAGALYGLEQIPEEWLKVIVRLEDIEELCKRFEKALPIS
ncbi:MAG: ADP-ribosylglycohydrolase family protein [Bacteroidota bacterium]